MGFTVDMQTTTAEKVLVTILIDVSESMGWKISGKNSSRIDEMIGALECFIAQQGSSHYIAGQSIQDIGNLLVSGELAIGLFSTRFSGAVKWLSLGENKTSFPFYSLRQNRPVDLGTELKPAGATPLAEAVKEAVKRTIGRYNELVSSNKNVKRPNLFIITDGKQDPKDDLLVSEASSLIRQYERTHQMMVYGISVFDGDSSDLAKVVLPKAIHILGKETKMADLVQILSVSVEKSNSARSTVSVATLHDETHKAIAINRRFKSSLNLNIID